MTFLGEDLLRKMSAYTASPEEESRCAQSRSNFKALKISNWNVNTALNDKNSFSLWGYPKDEEGGEIRSKAKVEACWPQESTQIVQLFQCGLGAV